MAIKKFTVANNKTAANNTTRQFYLIDTEAELPNSGLRAGDYSLCLDTGAFRVAESATTWGPGTTGLTVHPNLAAHDALGLATDADLLLYQLRSEKDQPLGYPSLDAGGLVPLAELPPLGSSLSVKLNGVAVDTAAIMNFIEPDATPVTDSPAGTARVDLSLYAILGGRSGGQTLKGGTAASNNLTLMSTAHATKGKILFGTSAYDEVNNRLGIGTASPSAQVYVTSTNITGYGVTLFHLLSTFPPGTGEQQSLGITAQAAPSAAGSAGDIIEGIAFAIDAAPSANWNGGARLSNGAVTHNSQGTSNAGLLAGHDVLLQQNLAASTVAVMRGLGITLQYKAGATTTAAGIIINRGVAGDAGTVATSVGLKIPASVGPTPTTDIAIQSQGGENRFVGGVNAGADASPISGIALQATGAFAVSAANDARFYNAGNTHYVGFKGPNSAGNLIWTLPLVDGSARQALTTDGAGTLIFASIAYSDLTGVPATFAPSAHNILSASHGDSLAGSVVDGDVIIGNATPAWSRLARSVPAANVRNVLGIDNGETRPSWKTALDGTNPAAIGTAGPGTSLIFAHRDHIHATGAGTPTTIAFGDAAAIGTGPAASMTDHRHGAPTTRTHVKRIPAGWFWPSTVSGCARRLYNGATNGVDTPCLDFATAVLSYAQLVVPLDDWNGGTITAKFIWMTADTNNAHTARFGIAGRAYASGDTFDQALGTLQNVDSNATSSANQVVISGATAACTFGGSPASGQLVRLRIHRDGTGDTVTSDARLIEVQITYTENL